MNKENIKTKIEKLSSQLLAGSIEPNNYAKVVEDLSLELEEDVFDEFADFLAQFHHPKDDPCLYGLNDLKKKIIEIFPDLKNK